MLDNSFCNKEVVIKIEVKDNNVDQALKILKRKLRAYRSNFEKKVPKKPF